MTNDLEGLRVGILARKEQHTMSDETSGADFLAGFIVGGLVGAAAALLLAPQSGEETRALMREKGIDLQERSAEMTAEARKRAQDLQIQAQDRASSYAAQASGKASEWQGRMQQAVAEGKTVGEQKKEELLSGLDAQDAPVQDNSASGE
jgi:gas vesicle protein